MKQFCDEEFLLNTKTSQKLYEIIKNDPIMDYHNHLSAQELSNNIKFENLTQLWLTGDHYKWRQMRTCGISENLITGDAPDYEKFLAFVGALELMVGNPVSQWAQLELKKYFQITQPLTLKNAQEIWDLTTEKLKKMTCRTFLEMSNVYAICTTDDPIDDLIYHQKLKDEWTKVKVIANFRPDNLLKIQLASFNDYLKKLEKITKTKINDYDSLWTALKQRIMFFHQNGCRSSDHGISKFKFIKTNAQEINQIVMKKIKGEDLSAEEVAKFDSALLLDLARTYSELNWAMLLHITVERDNNPALLTKLGHDIGCDSTSENLISESLNGFLSTLKSENKLCKISIFSLNQMNWPAVASLIGNYQENEKGIRGLVQFGTAWWFADTYSGNRKQIEMFAELSSLGVNIGMLTDSRSYSSFARHDYYRRILCDVIGSWAEQGMCVNDFEILTKLVKGIAFTNAQKYFGY